MGMKRKGLREWLKRERIEIQIRVEKDRDKGINGKS